MTALTLIVCALVACKLIGKGGKLSGGITEGFKPLAAAPIPIAGVAIIAFDLVQNGVQPVGQWLAFECLRHVVGIIPCAISRASG